MVQIKRAYEKASRTDGYRVLVDRLWPRGIRKNELPFDAWEKDLAPSDRLRREFGHDPGLWPQFRTDYRKELQSGAARDKLRSIAELARKRNVTLLYSARDEEHNNAVVLQGLIRSAIERTSHRAHAGR